MSKPVQLPAGANLSTLTALSMGMQLTSDAPDNATASPALLFKPRTASGSAAAASAAAASGASLSSPSSSSPKSSNSYVEPLSWALPAHLSAISAHKVAHLALVRQLLEAMRSPSQTVAPLPLDAAVAAVAEALCVERFDEAATAAWHYALGPGKLMLRLVQVAESTPNLVVLPDNGGSSNNPADKSKKTFFSAEAARAELCRGASIAVATLASEILSVAAGGQGGGGTRSNPAAAAAAVFAMDADMLIASLRAAAWVKQTTASPVGMLAPMSEQECALVNSIDRIFVEPALRALEQRVVMNGSSSCGANGAASWLPGLSELCAVADPAKHAAQLLSLLQRTQFQVHHRSNSNSRTYVDASSAAQLMSFLLEASSASSSSLSPLTPSPSNRSNNNNNNRKQDYCNEILDLWGWVQHTRAGLDPKARSAMVGALAQLNRLNEAFAEEQKMYDQGFVLDLHAQRVLIDAVRTSAVGSDNNSSASMSSGVITPGILQSLRRDAYKLYTCARTHWSFTLQQLDEGVRLRLLLLCWQAQLRGPVPRNIARAGSYPRRFVQGLLDAKDVEVGVSAAVGRECWNPRPETVAVLLRCLSVTGSVRNAEKSTATTDADDKTDAAAAVAAAAAGEGEGDAAAASTGASTSTPHHQGTAKLPLEELQLLSTAALQQVGIHTGRNVALEIDLWGCVIGAAATCSDRATLLDAAMALKAAAPEPAFLEAVMLTAMDVLRAYPWELSKLVVAELARALSTQPSDKVMSRLLAMQQNSKASSFSASGSSTSSAEEMSQIVQEFFGSAAAEGKSSAKQQAAEQS